MVLGPSDPLIFLALKTAFFEQGKQPEIIRTKKRSMDFDITSTKNKCFPKNRFFFAQ